MWLLYKNKFPNCSNACPGLSYSYILIEYQNKIREAHQIFQDKFGTDPIDLNDCSCGYDHLDWDYGETIQEVTYLERGCRYTGSEFIEEPQNDSGSYYTVEQFLYLSDLLVIGNIKTSHISEGMFCCRCKDYFQMVEPNNGNKFTCYLCRKYPWR